LSSLSSQALASKQALNLLGSGSPQLPAIPPLYSLLQAVGAFQFRKSIKAFTQPCAYLLYTAKFGPPKLFFLLPIV
ncbi:hypothetical protein PJP08_29570, partial [Mycobacterium kansasii]